MKFQFSHALSVHSFFPFSPSQGCHPPSRLARVFRFRFRPPFRFSPCFCRFLSFRSFSSRPAPFSPPFEKALVFFSIVSQTFSPFDAGDVRMSDDCSFLSLSNPHFLIFLFLITASRPLISPKTLQNSRSFSKFKLYSSRSRQNQMYTKIAYLVLLCSSFFLSLCPF